LWTGKKFICVRRISQLGYIKYMYTILNFLRARNKLGKIFKFRSRSPIREQREGERIARYLCLAVRTMSYI